MRIPDSLPDLAIVRVSTAAGPFRVGQTISLAFTTPTVGRLVAHDATPPQAEAFEGPIVPETMSATVTHAAGPYDVGDELTLSFIDARVARIHPNRVRPTRPIEPDAAQEEGNSRASAAPSDRSPFPHVASPVTHSDSETNVGGPTSTGSDGADRTSLGSQNVPDGTQHVQLLNDTERTNVARNGEAHVDVRQDERADADVSHRGFEEALPFEMGDSAGFASSDVFAREPQLNAEADERGGSSFRDVRPVVFRSRTSANDDEESIHPPIAIESDERLDADRFIDEPLNDDIGEVEVNAAVTTDIAVSGTDVESQVRADAGVDEAENSAETAVSDGAAVRPSMMPTTGVHVRLRWNRDRVRRFIQVVDKLFTVGRLGWYRHALAMRLLIPDEVTCGDSLADIEGMRHLHALRAAAVETLGRPLLAAFMPNFTVSAEWLGTIDSPAAARALAGLRDALTPYVEDDVAQMDADAASTVGVIERRELLGASSASVEALLPVLIPTASPNAALAARLSDYRRMLIDVFGQTARSAETVRVHQMAQPNHALDDRLWQLVGAVGEAFDGLAVA